MAIAARRIPLHSVPIADPQTSLTNKDWYDFFLGQELGNIKNFADDTAAAAGGVPLNGLYRTGSIVKIRVA